MDELEQWEKGMGMFPSKIDGSDVHLMKTNGIQLKHVEYKMDFTIITPKPLTEEQKKQLYNLIDSWNE